MPLTRDGLLVAFSGGVDSALLLYAAVQAAGAQGRVAALTTTSPSMPMNDLLDARDFCRELGTPHIIRESGELDNPLYTRNDADRCYHCKYELFDLSFEEARRAGLKHVVYGYNADDRYDERPGHRAALEKGVSFPLAEAGLDKQTIRACMRRFKLSLADKPASPCLASRLAHGVTVTEKRLRDVAEMEALLKKAGLSLYRVRINAADNGYFLRVECPEREMTRVVACAETLNEKGRALGYRWVTLDMGGYRMGGADK